jgi:hypothetical protein
VPAHLRPYALKVEGIRYRRALRAADRCLPYGGRDGNIAAAEYVAAQGGNPWPNCPDPLRDGASWDDTKRCESPGYSWNVDPPGYYCGPLQLDPKLWAYPIRLYGVPC